MKNYTIVQKSLSKKDYKEFKKELLKARGCKIMHRYLNSTYEVGNLYAAFVFKDTKKGHDHYDRLAKKCNNTFFKYK